MVKLLFFSLSLFWHHFYMFTFIRTGNLQLISYISTSSTASTYWVTSLFSARKEYVSQSLDTIYFNKHTCMACLNCLCTDWVTLSQDYASITKEEPHCYYKVARKVSSNFLHWIQQQKLWKVHKHWMSRF